MFFWIFRKTFRYSFLYNNNFCANFHLRGGFENIGMVCQYFLEKYSIEMSNLISQSSYLTGPIFTTDIACLSHVKVRRDTVNIFVQLQSKREFAVIFIAIIFYQLIKKRLTNSLKNIDGGAHFFLSDTRFSCWSNRNAFLHRRFSI